MDVRIMFIAVLASVVGVIVGGQAPPLSILPKNIDSNEHLSPDINPFRINIGLEGAVTQEDWDRVTDPDSEPSITVTGFMGCEEETTIIGKTMKTWGGREIYAFQGFRFGEAPVKNLRFKPAVPAGPYFCEDGEFNATHMGPKCPQMSMIGPVVSGEEDCLFLNVYTPMLPDNKTSLPVMVWIYGGGFVGGDASLYMPTRLLDKDIILVVIQYRVGSLGWFSLNNEDAPGNAGLWDQIEALRWVQDNIEFFGGNPGKVTVAGESAGSASVNYLILLKNETENLFHGVIAESGSALDHWSLDPDPLASAHLIAEKNDCDSEDLVKLHACMEAKSVHDITLNINQFVGEDRRDGEMGFRGVAPVIDGTLVTKEPRQYYEENDALDVPLLIGANKHEGAFVFSIIYKEFLEANGYLNDTEYLKDYMMQDLMATFGYNDPSNGIGEALDDAYIGGRDISEDFEYASPGYIDLAGMLFLKAGAWETAKLHAKYTNSSTFVYAFEFESDDTMFKIFYPWYADAPFKTTGVCHADEMMYLFSLPAYLEGNQITVKDRMVAMWTNFVIYGNPTPAEDNATWVGLNIPKWESLEVMDHHYMLIEGECTLMNEYPDRWHITLDDDKESRTTENPSSTTEDTHGPTQEDYDQIKHEKTVFMGCMIAFIVTTVILGALSGFFFFKNR